MKYFNIYSMILSIFLPIFALSYIEIILNAFLMMNSSKIILYNSYVS